LDDRLVSSVAAYRSYRKTSDLAAAPTRYGTFLFSDVYPDSICWPYYGVYMDKASIFNFPGIAHNQGGVVSFSDGHAEHHRWRDARTLSPHSANYHDHADASPGNADVTWFQQRATIPK
jgi:hypothetical protein